MYFLALIRIVIFFFVVPFLIGTAVTAKVLNKPSFLMALPFGYITVWAILEAVTIPVTIAKLPFTVVTVIICVASALLAALGAKILLKDRPSFDLESNIKKLTIADIICMILFAAVAMYTIYKLLVTFFYDEDDSRFIVNAIDIIKDNRILASDPVTGRPIWNAHGDFSKDLIAQWASFLAIGQIGTGLPVAVFAHTVYPYIALFLLFCLMAALLGYCSEKSKEITVILPTLTVLLVLLIYGCYTLQGSERFIMTRVWQGKASLAGIGITSVILAFIIIDKLIDQDKRNIRGFFLLLISNISACFMSSMAVVLGITLISSYGLVLGIRRKSIKLAILSAVCCVPNIILFLLSHYYTLYVYIGA